VPQSCPVSAIAAAGRSGRLAKIADAASCGMNGGADLASGGALLVQGVLAGTRIATLRGWQAVETLRPGDAVRTVDAGVQPLAEARRARLACPPPALWPLRVPAGALDCREALILLPDQRLVLDLAGLSDTPDPPQALVPAAAPEGWRGIRRVRPPPGLGAVTLAFAEPQLVLASRGMRLACPGAALDGYRANADLVALSLLQARHLVTCLIARDLGRALQQRCA
jgi:hypothetical protein